MNLSWMAWTSHVIIFIIIIMASIACMGIWEYLRPGGGNRLGIFGYETTRGDRLFLSFLSSGFIHLGWIGYTNLTIWFATFFSIIWAIFIFKYY